jgi:hypothetical protein
MSDEDYGQFTAIDINDELYKYNSIQPKYFVNVTYNKRLDYYNDHYHLDIEEYRSNNTLTPSTSINSFYSNIDNDIQKSVYETTKGWVIYISILFTSVWSIYIIFTL